MTEYWIVGVPYTSGDGIRRDVIASKDENGYREAYVTVPTECITDVLEAIRKAYEQGRSDERNGK